MLQLEITSPETLKAADLANNPIQQSFKFPTEIVQLPSKGLLYPDGHPLRSGEVEIKYMTAKEEDILSTKSFIEKGVVLDKLLQSLIVTKFDYDTLLVGDRNAIMLAARIYGYGPEYETKIRKPNGKEIPITINLLNIGFKEVDYSQMVPGTNKFSVELPASKLVANISLFTVGKLKDFEQSLSALEKVKFGNGVETNVTTMYRYLIDSFDGVPEDKKVETINNLTVADTRKLRSFINLIQPDIDLELDVEDPDTGETFRGKVQLGITLFYPDLEQRI